MNGQEVTTIFSVKRENHKLCKVKNKNLLTTGIVHREVKIYTRFFLISNTFISNVRLKLTKARQHPEAELLLFENYLLSSFLLSFKNNKRYSKKRTKKTSASI